MPLYNPFAVYAPSGGWRVGHLAIDYPTPIGFRFGAPADGIYYKCPDQLERRSGQAGKYGYLLLADGSKIYFCHLKAHLASHGQKVEQGDFLGETGNTGYVRPAPTEQRPYLGAHMHTYGIRRLLRWNWTIGAVKSIVRPAPAKPAPASGSSKPFKTSAYISFARTPGLKQAKPGARWGFILPGQVIEIGSISGDFAKGLHKGRIFYVDRTRIFKRVVVAQYDINLRKSPKMSARSNVMAVKGKALTVIGASGSDASSTFLKVRFIGKNKKTYTGWVPRAYVR